MSTPNDSQFDPYHKWLGIPPAEQPPNCYRLLGLTLLEQDPDVIATAADRQMAHVKSFAAGRYASHSQELLNELSKARVRLLNPDRKREYDAQLRKQLAARKAKAKAKAAKQQQAAQPQAAAPAAMPATPAASQPAAAPAVQTPELPAIKPAVRRRRRKRKSGGGNALLANLLWLVLGLGMLLGLVWLAGQLAT
ncbi:hypothetical protein [Aeoliella mucimassa]|uniref:Uncharacterized protein n=1 Tax=Aeoliella mucimassa TaxID=2527972 RepID=A0A518AUN5_9BACT|nr:hypothetical protein [Aeoliella mucimassa]QDU58427.1 hypothetical protein Pan181_46620 [Aeoliella mucimassa]